MNHCCCTVDDLVHTIGRKYALPILVRIGDRQARFSELEHDLGVSSSTLSETLADLGRAGLVRRTVLDGSPPVTEYALTAAGIALRDNLRTLLERVQTLETG